MPLDPAEFESTWWIRCKMRSENLRNTFLDFLGENESDELDPTSKDGGGVTGFRFGCCFDILG